MLHSAGNVSVALRVSLVADVAGHVCCIADCDFVVQVKCKHNAQGVKFFVNSNFGDCCAASLHGVCFTLHALCATLQRMYVLYCRFLPLGRVAAKKFCCIFTTDARRCAEASAYYIIARIHGVCSVIRKI